MITLDVNGQERSVDAPDNMPLLWVLRDILGLTGTKYGCGVGSCGSCSVLIDDTAALSCLLTAGSIGARKITTIEGIGAGELHPVQKAWMELDVPQCGYCQAGQIINAVALLRATPNPTDEDIDESMKNNVCRCGSYTRIKQAIRLAAK